jgi:autotransporter passenger strand-loop-strand repeat protein
VIGAVGEEIVSKGGSAGDEVVNSGGVLDDLAVVSGARVNSGGWLAVSGKASADVISRGGTEVLGAGATISSDVVLSGGELLFDSDVQSGQTITFGAPVTARTVFDGVTLSSGALMGLESATVLSGATLSLTAAALAGAATVSSGGVLVGPGPLSSGTDYGLVSGVRLSSGYLLVESGGATSGVRIGADSEEVVSWGGVGRGDVIDGGLEVVGGVARGELVKGGSLVIGLGGAASGDIIVSGAEFDDGGVTVGETIRSGGRQVIDKEYYPGVASGTIVSSGGRQQVSSGVTVATRVLSGGIETILRPGHASGTVILGGYEFDFGVASGDVVRSGGHEVVEGHGLASGSVISRGGHEGVRSNGVAVATTVSAGGAMKVYSGGAVSGGLSIQGGWVTISGTVAAGQAVSFTGSGGVLGIDNLAAFGAVIAGFGAPGERIDLGGFVRSSAETATWIQSGTSGTLTVHDGGQTANLTLIGTYATGDFSVVDDGRHGTYVMDNSAGPVATQPVRFAQAVAGLAGGRSAAGVAAIHGGGSALIGPSPLLALSTSGR